MDTMPCHWNEASGQDSFPRPRAITNTLSRLAQLIAIASSTNRKDMLLNPSSPDPPFARTAAKNSQTWVPLAATSRRSTCSANPIAALGCGLEFTLASTMQLHRCLDVPCRLSGVQREATVGLALPVVPGPGPGPPHPRGPPPAATPQPQAPRRRQPLRLYPVRENLRPQAGASVPPAGRRLPTGATQPQGAGFLPPSPAPGLSPDHTPHALPGLPATSTFSTERADTRTPASFASGRSAPQQAWPAINASSTRTGGRKKRQKLTTVREFHTVTKNPSFPCRSCDKVFSQTSMLYLHRKEEHRREAPVARQQKGLVKSTRQRRKSETYPCLHCGKVFLHHLTRWAHFKSYSTHYQTHLANSGKLGKTHIAGKAAKDLRVARRLKLAPPSKPWREESKPLKDQNKKAKTHVASMDRKQESGPEEESAGKGRRAGVPCPSCGGGLRHPGPLCENTKWFTSRQSVSARCSMCTARVILPETAQSVGTVVYHCVPCEQVFVDLDTFLQHCQRTFLFATTMMMVDEGEKGGEKLSGDLSGRPSLAACDV
ncbi:zinc finger protein 341 [Electrophorus electricus]|uniref:zinc finger protein 341 n=1 Tax=Electrophorus electricus TaxID=8005 RepID=UPI0015D053F5|nr:zinc finger protein 341 [Electrophorus electricus]